jgi:hypothetical protein
MPYDERSKAWGREPARPASDTLTIDAKNLAAATVDTRRARLSCSPVLDVRSDGPLDLRLDCGPPAAAARRARRCARTVRVKLPRVKGRRIVSVVATRNGRRVKRVRGRNVRSIAVRRPTTRAFSLRLRARTTRGGKVTVLRRFRAC